jgi:hypothetical protein
LICGSFMSDLLLVCGLCLGLDESGDESDDDDE